MACWAEIVLIVILLHCIIISCVLLCAAAFCFCPLFEWPEATILFFLDHYVCREPKQIWVFSFNSCSKCSKKARNSGSVSPVHSCWALTWNCFLVFGFERGIHEINCSHPCCVVLLYVVQRWMRHITVLWSFSRTWWRSWESLENKITLWLHRRRCWRGRAQNRTSKCSSYTSNNHTRPEREGTP